MEEVTEQAGEFSLGPKQREVAYAMVRGEQAFDEVMKEYEVGEEEFTDWVRDGRFTEYAASLARGFAEADAPYVWKDLLDLTHNGSVPAIRLYFDILNKKPAVSKTEPSVEEEIAGLRKGVFSDSEAEPGKETP